MNEKELQHLLRRADDKFDTVAFPDPAAIRRQALAKRRNQRLSLCLLLLVAMLFTPHFFTSRPAPVRTPPTDALADLHARIDIETTLLLAKRRASGQMAPLDPTQARESAAETLVLAGNRRLANGQPAAAADAYSLAVHAFPDTTWAAQAHNALRNLQ